MVRLLVSTVLHCVHASCLTWRFLLTTSDLCVSTAPPTDHILHPTTPFPLLHRARSLRVSGVYRPNTWWRFFLFLFNTSRRRFKSTPLFINTFSSSFLLLLAAAAVAWRLRPPAVLLALNLSLWVWVRLSGNLGYPASFSRSVCWVSTHSAALLVVLWWEWKTLRLGDLPLLSEPGLWCEGISPQCKPQLHSRQLLCESVCVCVCYFSAPGV